ncbi:YceI family protein [Aerolutibacter ruishenii]|uniref:YceI family protein n=1 Tax=Aerolutibacter ruishenii TaxID=686800 RepID=UPI001F556EE9|nr:YceI family protein [Lysobacter ruishenii]
MDAERSSVGFELRTRWGQRIHGTFGRPLGHVTELGDSRHQVRLSLSVASIEVADSPYYTQMARGPEFFDAARFPHVDFLSEPYRPSLAHDGGKLRGKLTLRGVTRAEFFTLQPAECARPGWDCDVVATGIINRANYGLSGYRLALADRVRFTMRIRLKNEDE